MRHDRPVTKPEEALKACEAMLRDDTGLRLFLPLLPPGSTVDDARRFRERQKQAGRRPSACMRAIIEAT